MKEVVYSARPELASPGEFLMRAAVQLRASVPVAMYLLRSDLRARYRRAWLGYLWLILPSAAIAALAAFVTSRRLVSVPPTDMAYPAFVLTGVIFWQLFVEALNAPLQQLTARRHAISRISVPHEALFLAGILETLVNCALRLAVIAAPALAWYGIAPGGSLILLPAALLALALLGLAVGLLAAPLGMLYEDVGRLLALATGVWLFLSPVLYAAPESGLLGLNPVTPLIGAVRASLSGGAATGGFAWVLAASLAAAVVAWLVYRIARPHIASRSG